jgi:hypothetical protein
MILRMDRIAILLCALLIACSRRHGRCDSETGVDFTAARHRKKHDDLPEAVAKTDIGWLIVELKVCATLLQRRHHSLQ